jgi:hypothetical protein
MENYGEIKVDEIYGSKEYNSIANRQYIINSSCNILNLHENKIYLNNNVLTLENKTKLINKLKQYNSYVIHIIEFTYITYDNLPNNVLSNGVRTNIYSRREEKEIIFIDNYCNYYALRQETAKFQTNQHGNQSYTSSNIFKFIEYKNIKQIKMPNFIIDFIKRIKTSHDIWNINHSIHPISSIIEGITLSIDVLDFKNKEIEIQKAKEIEKDKEIAFLKSKLEEQTKLNDDICKRMCELKEQLFNQQ